VLPSASWGGADTVADDHLRAWLLVGQRHPDEAIPILKSVIARAPEFTPAYATLAEAFGQKKARDEAEAYFGSLFGDPQRGGLAHYGMGTYEHGYGQWPRAAHHFSACVQQRPQSVACYSLLASMLMNATANRATRADLDSRMAGERGRPYTCLGFTRLLLAQRKIGESAKSARECLAAAEVSGDQEFLAEAHQEIAEAANLTGHHDEYLAHTLEELRIQRQQNDPEAASETGHEVCYAYAQLDRHEEAAACLEEALASARQQGNRAFVGILGFAGQYYAERGNLDRAIGLRTEQLRLAQEDGESEEAVEAQINLGKIHLTRGDFDQARQSLEEALAGARADGRRFQEAFVLRGLSLTYASTGDPILALRHANESLRIFQELGKEHQAGAGIGNLPEIYASMGDWPSALRFARQSYQSSLRFEDLSEQQDTLAVVGDVLLGMGKNREAKECLERSLALSEATKSPWFEIAALLGLGRAHLALGETAQAVRSFEAALELAREAGNVRAEANALTQLGRCYRRLGNAEKAREHLNSALTTAARINLVEVTLAARRELAAMASREGHYAVAFEHLQAAAATVEALRGRIPTPDLKADFARENAKLYEDLVGVLARLDRREPGKGWDRRAFEYAERGRARSFLDLLAESKAQITKGLSTAQVQRRNELESSLSRAMAALAERDSAANRRAADMAEGNIEEWIRSIRTTNPEYEALRYPRPIDAVHAGALASAQSAAILEYALGNSESYLWVITPHRFQMFRLPARGVIEKAVSQYRATIAKRPQGSQFDAWLTPSAALGDMLVKPALPYLEAEQTLLIVPDGILHYLPFETLRISDVDGTARCLVEKFPMYYMPSVSVMAQLERRPTGSARRFDLLAYGDPVFSLRSANAAPNADLVRGVYESAGIRFPPLPNTRREVEGIGRLFSPERRIMRLGAEATEASVKRTNLSEYRLLHFATHAVIDDRSPARSGIVLSLVNTGAEDGILRMNEVYNLEMDADAVVLSACQTGLGNLVRGEGMIGLTRAFLYAGARHVAVSLWDVADLTAPEFMQAFYQHLRKGEQPGAALRAAKLEMLRSGSAVRTHPYFWAPFVLEGAPDTPAKRY
jgi:CHAT domain-containing protein/lipopolysaccharide biosynthesis regulator YciM